MSPSLQKHINSGKFVEVEGIKLFYSEVGEGSETILLLHGFFTTSYHFRNVAELLSHKYKVISLDWAGVGLSEKPSSPLSHRLQAFYLHQVAESLVGDKKIHIVTHDYALPIVAFFSKEHPERIKSLTILNGFLNLPKFRYYSPINILKIPLLGDLLSYCFRPPILKILVHLFLTKKGYRVSAEWEKDTFTLLFHGKNRKQTLEFIRNVDRSSHTLRDVEEGLKSMVGLRQVIIGEEDYRISPYQTEFIKETLRTSAHAVVPSGHLSMEECPELISQKIEYLVDTYGRNKTKTFQFKRKDNQEEE
ncbi:alpha/beta hydrolase family protein [Leptospira ryugenii]|uniref:Alpha/beta hydrolase family protein n=1 Tax=Leptospira ryugenii TaxID=1917863 RepID=A0A2P2E058_9LEPT|nr:alpha/beta hydrolase [Leptospira ryugenii]GBF50260.1 alpha/beta hydrolase family protein [Leptospira ryugenii]